MPIDALPTPPLRNDPATFADRGDALLGALPTFVTQANALESNVEAKEASAASSAAAAAISEAAARVSAATASYKGLWTGLTGALNMPASVFHAGKFWALNVNLANVASAQPGVSGSWTLVQTGADAYPYADRATLRGLTPAAGDQAIVEGLGLFVWRATSTEVDDDQTCFLCAGGAWELVAASPDYVHAAWVASVGDLETSVSGLQTSVSGLQTSVSGLAASKLTGSFTMSLTGLNATSSSAFTATVAGAAVGDSVLVNPGNGFGNGATDQARLSYVAYVSAPNTVTVSIRNSSADGASMTASTWQVMVLKP